MYASVSTSPVRESCITHGTSPRSSKRTFPAFLSATPNIEQVYESPARVPEGRGSAQIGRSRARFLQRFFLRLLLILAHFFSAAARWPVGPATGGGVTSW